MVNPRSDEVEEPAAICDRVYRMLRDVDADRIFLNPDCGFGTFASHPMNTAQVAERKLAAMTAAANVLREKHGGTANG